jgi:hypothetical protein
MATLSKPVLFSAQFSVAPESLSKLGLFDPILNADTKLFIDPLLLKVSDNATIRGAASAAFDTYFGNIVKVLQHSKQVGDLPWRNADRLFTFKEPRETCLGYGDRTTHGSAIGAGLRKKLMITAKEIIDLGISDPELFALLGLLEEGVGADRISDMTTNAIKSALYDLNTDVISTLGVSGESFTVGGANYQLARNPFETGERIPVLLIPKDILRQLPIAHDWSDVADAASKNAEVRRRVNQKIGDLWAVRTRKDKLQVRNAVLTDKTAFQTLMEAVGLAEKSPYDPESDIEGHYLWRRLLSSLAVDYPVKIAKPKIQNHEELERVVDQILVTFEDLVENKGQWEHFWHGTECRHERAVQRFFFAVAEVYCKSNNLDVSPETNSGGGPVDFKFSSGYSARVLVEIKLSTGKVVHGYETQLEVYKKAESTFSARYLIVDVGGMGKKLNRVLKLKNEGALRGDAVAPIIVVDGRRKLSASKRTG